MRKLLGSLLVAGLVAAVPGATPARAAAVYDCEYRGGFKTLHDLIPDIVGDCLENERHDPVTGDALQWTAHGILIWRKADNWTAFTDGPTTWVLGPEGVQSRPSAARFPWEAGAGGQRAAPEMPAVVQQAVADAAQRTGLPAAAIQVVQVEARDWPDTSLGCPMPGFFYSQIVTPGFLIVLDAGGQRLEYHSDRSRVVFCPTSR